VTSSAAVNREGAYPVRPYVDFYRQEEISPVAQDISDLDRHFQRRQALYRHLGISPGLVAGKSIIEFGPGSGHNALYTTSLNPFRYVLVDGNPLALERSHALLDQYKVGDLPHQFVQSQIEDFYTDERFDMVLCEGVLSWQIDPVGLLRKVAALTKPGGLVVITCMDNVGFFAECLRRVLATTILKPGGTTAQDVATLLPVFGPQLDTLPGMSRSYEDWILDNIIFPYHGRAFSIGAAIEALDPDFDAFGTSPQFLVDDRWYKNIHGSDLQYNQRAMSLYRQSLHNHMNGRLNFSPRSEESNLKLLFDCDAVFELEELFRENRSKETLSEIMERSTEIRDQVRTFSPSTAAALDEFIDLIGAEPKAQSPDFKRFGEWFGQGQQYLSFIRTSGSTFTK
jgi:ubiquinone/menaquinone biosynthesis C-methylase UbiE